MDNCYFFVRKKGTGSRIDSQAKPVDIHFYSPAAAVVSQAGRQITRKIALITSSTTATTAVVVVEMVEVLALEEVRLFSYTLPFYITFFSSKEKKYHQTNPKEIKRM